MKGYYIGSTLVVLLLIAIVVGSISGANEFHDDCTSKGGKIIHGHGHYYCVKKDVFL